MRRLLGVLALIGLLAPAAGAGRVEDGVLTVDGEPFFPLGSWNSGYTTAEDIARVGMNTSFRGGPSTDEALEGFRAFMRSCGALGIQVVPYVSYGGAGIEPWPPDAVRTIAKLSSEPNLLAWYVGDDIGMPHLPGIRQTVGILREETPDIPTVADYIAKETPEAKTTFTQYVDIRCQYTYPIPDEPFATYLAFFDQQREFVGDPLWTWVQSFMWGRTGTQLNVGAEGPGPIPDPEQVRLLSFAAINRGVRGLLFFPHHELHRLPELAAEVALTCREIRLVEKHLAAGEPAQNLDTSHPDVNAAAFRYGESTVISAAVFGPQYHRWVDEGIVRDVTIDCPWTEERLPEALLVATPDVVQCAVTKASAPGAIRVTVPSLELAGFVLLSTNAHDFERLRAGVAQIPGTLRTLVVPAAAAQTRKASDVIWRIGHDNLYAPSVVMEAMRAVERCSEALDDQDYTGAVRAWREALRCDRIMLDKAMRLAEEHREIIPPQQRRFLLSPHGLHNIHGLAAAPPADEPWRFIRKWLVAGPFPLEWEGEGSERIPAGFDRAYPPERTTEIGGVFETMDGPAIWRYAESDASGLLDFLPFFATTENTVCYARCRIVAPRDMAVRLSLGSNDGARAWVNGEDVFAWCSVPDGGRTAAPHQNRFDASLKAGSNDLLVKVENLGANWQLYLAVDDPGRELQFQAP